MKQSIVEVKHLKYFYPNSQRPAINDVNLNIHYKDWVSVIGLNGSGKSTLVKLLDGLIPKSSGQIIVDKLPMVSKNLMKIRSKIGIVFQNPQDQFVGATVKDEIAFGLENQLVAPAKINKLILKALDLVGMSGYENTLIDDLSGGQQQRIAIADVIVMRPKILILDEATSMLDPQGRLMIINLIKSLKQRFNLTVIDITHDIEETRYAQRIIIMSNGKILLSGKPDQVFKHETLFQGLHLSLPDPDRLRHSLRSQGLSVPNHHVTETGMLAWLRRLFSRM